MEAQEPVRPSRLRALESLPVGGSVLDVGVGGGASSLGLAPKAATITGVDCLEGMLALFEATARAAGVSVRTVLGTWPAIADEVEPADIVVSHHALYGVSEIEDFVTALTTRAFRRVVLELWTTPPDVGVDPLWKSLHGIERPSQMVADEAEAVVRSMGLAVERKDVVMPPRKREVTPELVALVRRRLHVGADRDPEIEAFLHARDPEEPTAVALSWPGEAG